MIQIPDNAKLQKETVLSLVKGSTVFINYLGVCSIAPIFGGSLPSAAAT